MSEIFVPETGTDVSDWKWICPEIFPKNELHMQKPFVKFLLVGQCSTGDLSVYPLWTFLELSCVNYPTLVATLFLIV